MTSDEHCLKIMLLEIVAGGTPLSGQARHMEYLMSMDMIDSENEKPGTWRITEEGYKFLAYLSAITMRQPAS